MKKFILVVAVCLLLIPLAAVELPSEAQDSFAFRVIKDPDTGSTDDGGTTDLEIKLSKSNSLAMDGYQDLVMFSGDHGISLSSNDFSEFSGGFKSFVTWKMTGKTGLPHNSNYTVYEDSKPLKISIEVFPMVSENGDVIESKIKFVHTSATSLEPTLNGWKWIPNTVSDGTYFSSSAHGNLFCVSEYVTENVSGPLTLKTSTDSRKLTRTYQFKDAKVSNYNNDLPYSWTRWGSIEMQILSNIDSLRGGTYTGTIKFTVSAT